jgi:ribosomal protein L29
LEINEIRKLSNEDIKKKIIEDKEELFKNRLAQSSGTLEKPVVLRQLRKEIARLKNCINRKRNGW